jgi:anti-sigma factor RsiW
MSCSSVDVKAFFLGELAPSEKTSVEGHVRACESCREELERLNLMQTALLSLEQEEVPQRIAFVSDKVFEPRWWQTMWRSGPTMGFASALMLAAAILVHAYSRPVVQPATGGTVDTAQIEQRIQREVSARVDAAVASAISQTEARQTEQIAKVLDAAGKKIESQRRNDMALVQQAVRYYEQQNARLMVAANNEQRLGQ